MFPSFVKYSETRRFSREEKKVLFLISHHLHLFPIPPNSPGVNTKSRYEYGLFTTTPCLKYDLFSSNKKLISSSKQLSPYIFRSRSTVDEKFATFRKASFLIFPIFMFSLLFPLRLEQKFLYSNLELAFFWLFIHIPVFWNIPSIFCSIPVIPIYRAGFLFLWRISCMVDIVDTVNLIFCMLSIPKNTETYK